MNRQVISDINLLESKTARNHNSYMERAKQVSKLSPMKKKLGAVMVDHRGSIIATGYNSYQTHPVYGTKKKSYTYVASTGFMHAEGACLYDAKKNGYTPQEIQNCSIYVYRTNWNLSKPCVYCQKMLIDFGIKTVYYTAKLTDNKQVIIREEYVDPEFI